MADNSSGFMLHPPYSVKRKGVESRMARTGEFHECGLHHFERNSCHSSLRNIRVSKLPAEVPQDGPLPRKVEFV
jgi:hypothetical protein